MCVCVYINNTYKNQRQKTVRMAIIRHNNNWKKQKKNNKK